MSEGDVGFDLWSALADLYGWKRDWVGGDPWGSLQAYGVWLEGALKPDTEHLVFVATVLSRGSTYLAHLACQAICQIVDFTKLGARDLLSRIEMALLLEDGIWRLGVPPRAESDWLINYEKLLHPAYVAFLLKQKHPFQLLASTTQGIMDGRLAEKEEIRRGNTIFHLANYIVSESPSLQEVVRQRTPNLPLPNKDESFSHLWESVRGKLRSSEDSEPDFLKSTYELIRKIITEAYEERASAEMPATSIEDKERADIEWDANALSFWAKVDPKNEAKLRESVAKRGTIYQRKVSQRLSQWKALDELINLQALTIDGNLANYLSVVAKHDRQDEARVERRTTKREITESQIDADREAEGKDVRTPYLERIPHPEPQEAKSLEELELPLDRLTDRERWVIEDVLQGFKEGYDFDSKKGRSFRARWGGDYQKNIKAWDRAKPKLKQP